jgi:tRNA nucleotidyltransferase (CCA-adding enzyme)
MPQNHSEIEGEILKRITPSNEEKERVNGVVQSILEKVDSVIERYDIPIKSMPVGSTARDTYLPDPDIDIFMTFPLETPLADLERIGLEIGETVLEGEKRYAEHPYIHGMVEGLEVDLVPCYKIERPDQKKTAVDRTPLHTKYVMEHLKNEQTGEVRLLKRFLVGVGVYGAEAKVQGFSGYLTELLVLKFGTFNDLIREASTWSSQQRIELVSSERKFDEPLVVPDPIDLQRNVASALSMSSFATFVLACREYVESPRIEFFFPKGPPRLGKDEIGGIMKERGTRFLALIFEVPDVVDDVLYPQLRKCEQSLSGLCKQNGFVVQNSAFEVIGNEAIAVLEFEIFELPSVEKHFGPPVWVKNAHEFLEKWRKRESTMSKPYVEDDRLVVDIRRKHTNAYELVSENIGGMSLGKNINDSIKKSYELLMDENIIQERFFDFLTRFYNSRMPWEN